MGEAVGEGAKGKEAPGGLRKCGGGRFRDGAGRGWAPPRMSVAWSTTRAPAPWGGNRKPSFALAYFTDEDEGERERGDNFVLTLLDASGHRDFVPPTTRETVSANTGLLVAAAALGEFEAGFAATTARCQRGRQETLWSCTSPT